MQFVPIRELFLSKYCRITFIFLLVLFYMVMPKTIFFSNNWWLAIVYILISATLVTCVVKSIKEKIKYSHKQGLSLVAVIFSAFGIGVFHTCGIAAPVCGAGAGFAIAINWLYDYGIYVIYISLIFQIIALRYLHCFSDVRHRKSK